MSKPAAERPLWVHQDRLDLSFPAVQGTALLLKARFLLAGMAGRVKFFSQQRMFFCWRCVFFVASRHRVQLAGIFYDIFPAKQKNTSTRKEPPTAGQDTLQRGMRANGASCVMQGRSPAAPHKKARAVALTNHRPKKSSLTSRLTHSHGGRASCPRCDPCDEPPRREQPPVLHRDP